MRHHFITIKLCLCVAFTANMVFAGEMDAYEMLLKHEKTNGKGLEKPQPPENLPTSIFVTQLPILKSKVTPQTLLVPSNDNELIITQGWELIEANKAKADGATISRPSYDSAAWYNATVPGTVLSTLVDVGVYPDPYIGLNNMAIPETLCRQDWWYRVIFNKPVGFDGKTVTLRLNGINYEANIWLNGKQIGSLKGAFIRGAFDVTLQEQNILAVQILPPPNPGIPHEQSARDPKGPNGGQLCQNGPTFIASEGWDWMPGIRDRNIGIWQDVRLALTAGGKIIDPQVITDLPLPETSTAEITIRTVLEAEAGGEYQLEALLAGKTATKTLTLKKGSQTLTLSAKDLAVLHMENPRLWWPNGYGDPALYSLTLTLSKGGAMVDQKTVRFGVRELSYEFGVATKEKKAKRILFDPIRFYANIKTYPFNNLVRGEGADGVEVPTLNKGVSLDAFTPLKSENAYLTIKVNGQPIFCKGGNWGMDDAMKRVSRERLEPCFKLHKDAHYTMIRNWTGESTEEVFFDLADEYGLLVWNDFWMSTQGHNMPPRDFDLFMTNAEDTVKRFRNHPSIAIWCARNEGYAPDGLEQRLAQTIALHDGTRHYISNSRNLNLRSSGPWTFRDDIEYYFESRAEGFSTEVGTQSHPTAETLAAMIPKEDLWPMSDTWFYHDLHSGYKQYIKTISQKYGNPDSVEEYAKKAQMLNYISHRAIFEAWNNKLWENGSGILLWMTHPAWPSLIWQTYSSDYETCGSYYGSMKACEPIHIQINAHDRRIIVANTTLKAYNGTTAQVQVLDTKGKVLFDYQEKHDLPANAKIDCSELVIPQSVSLPDVYFIKLILTGENKALLSDNFYWESTTNQFLAFNSLRKVTLKGKASMELVRETLRGEIILSNPTDTVALTIKLNLRDGKTGQRILPAYFKDGYFFLMPGEKRTVQFEAPGEKVPAHVTITAEGYNVDRQVVAERKQ